MDLFSSLYDDDKNSFLGNPRTLHAKNTIDENQNEIPVEKRSFLVRNYIPKLPWDRKRKTLKETNVKSPKKPKKDKSSRINKENENHSTGAARNVNGPLQVCNKQRNDPKPLINPGDFNDITFRTAEPQHQFELATDRDTDEQSNLQGQKEDSIQCFGNILNGNSNMSMYEYHYDSASNSGNGLSGIGTNKYITSKNTYYGGDSSTKQQLSDIALSMASLCNIGNSCYMNSVIYTLRFTPTFLHNLHHLVNNFSQIINKKDMQTKLKSASLGRNVSGLQGQNSRSYSSKDLVSLGSSSSSSSSSPAFEIVKTSQQTAMEKLHELFKNLTNNELSDAPEPYQSDLFLKAIQDVNPIFEGNQQQDAHEFLMCILDSIRESCKTLKKIITDHPEIIVSGFIEPIERPIVKAPTLVQPVAEKKTNWFKRRKEDKTKNIPIDSPSKEANSSDSNSVHDATNDKNVTGSADNETLLCNKQNIQEKIKALGLDFFTDDFIGITASTIQCLACETTTEQRETMIDLSVPITDNMETHEPSESFIQSLGKTNTEKFQGENKFRCENCMGLTEANRKISYPKLPRILIIQLKRFSGGMEKINSYIPTPFTLPCFCATCIADRANSKEHEYKLYSVITHVGATMCAGHYIAYTCSLNHDSVYNNCPRDINRKETQLVAQTMASAITNTMTTTAAATTANAAIVNEASSSAATLSSSAPAVNTSKPTTNSSSSTSGPVNSVIGLTRKIGLGRKKSSANNVDMTKNVKNYNGVRGMVNGVDSAQLTNNTSQNAAAVAPASATVPQNILCPGESCCSIKMKTLSLNSNNEYSNGNENILSNGLDYHSSENARNCGLSSVYSDQFHHSNTNNGSSVNNGIGPSSKASASEHIWYMCDDDKIKAIPQHEFREMLLPKKNMITPYLLFYVRNDVFGSH